MPTYTYKCNACSHEWERVSRIANRKEPLEEPCPECGVTGQVVQTIGGAPGLADPYRMGRIKPSSDFNSILKRIDKENPGNSMKIRD